MALASTIAWRGGHSQDVLRWAESNPSMVLTIPHAVQGRASAIQRSTNPLDLWGSGATGPSISQWAATATLLAMLQCLWMVYSQHIFAGAVAQYWPSFFLLAQALSGHQEANWTTLSLVARIPPLPIVGGTTCMVWSPAKRLDSTPRPWFV